MLRLSIKICHLAGGILKEFRTKCVGYIGPRTKANCLDFKEFRRWLDSRLSTGRCPIPVPGHQSPTWSPTRPSDKFHEVISHVLLLMFFYIRSFIIITFTLCQNFSITRLITNGLTTSL